MVTLDTYIDWQLLEPQLSSWGDPHLNSRSSQFPITKEREVRSVLLQPLARYLPSYANPLQSFKPPVVQASSRPSL